MIKKIFVALALTSATTGCATPYQENGLLGGVHATRIDDTTVQIAARGNAFTDPDTIGRYVMRKAAEETVADGFDLFLLVSSADRTTQGTIVTDGSATTNTTFFGQNATSRTTYSAPQVIRYVKPGETVTIKMYKGSKPANAPANLYEARDVLKYLAPTPAQQPTPPHG